MSGSTEHLPSARPSALSAALVGFAVLIATTAAIGIAESDPGLYLSRITSERTEGAWTDTADPVLADLYVNRPGALAAQLGGLPGPVVVAADDESVRVSIGAAPTLGGRPTGAHAEASFVVDFDQPGFATWAEAAQPPLGSESSLEQLVAFVFENVPRKNYRNGFDIASQVAASGEGDCTEHAVVLTALARSQGWPARVVFGVLLIDDGATFQSFGHAWSEIHDGDQWRIADATQPGETMPDARIRYLPLSSLSDEGPGYAMALMEFAMLVPTRVAQVPG